MAKQSPKVAEATRQLVEGDAKARQEMAATQKLQASAAAQARKELGEMHSNLQTSLQSERQSLDRQHDELEQERRQIESQRRPPRRTATLPDALWRQYEGTLSALRDIVRLL